jgi:hypothetical protein
LTKTVADIKRIYHGREVEISRGLTKMLQRALLIFILVAQPIVARSDTSQRAIVVRERASASLLNNEFTFEVLKIRGYSIKIRAAGEDSRVLKLGESIYPENSECAVVFTEIASETQIARFLTDCP